MHDAGLVDRGESLQHLSHKSNGLGRGERPFGTEPASKIATFDEIHHDGEAVTLDDEVTHAHDVLRAQPQEDGTLTHEPLDHHRVLRQLAAQQLDGHRAVGTGPRPHLAGRATAEHLVELVPGTELDRHSCLPSVAASTQAASSDHREGYGCPLVCLIAWG